MGFDLQFVGLKLLLLPQVLLACLPMSVLFGWYYCLVTSLPETYSSLYGFSTGSIGLLYLTSGVGNCAGSVLGGILSDRFRHWQLKRKNGQVTPEDRLVPLYLGIPPLVAGFLIYGWLLHAHVHWFPPMVGLFLSKLLCFHTLNISR